MQIRRQEEGKKLGSCGCGRSPTGDCIGWHGLSEDLYKHQLMLYLEEQMRQDNEIEANIKRGEE